MQKAFKLTDAERARVRAVFEFYLSASDERRSSSPAHNAEALQASLEDGYELVQVHRLYRKLGGRKPLREFNQCPGIL